MSLVLLVLAGELAAPSPPTYDQVSVRPARAAPEAVIVTIGVGGVEALAVPVCIGTFGRPPEAGTIRLALHRAEEALLRTLIEDQERGHTPPCPARQAAIARGMARLA